MDCKAVQVNKTCHYAGAASDNLPCKGQFPLGATLGFVENLHSSTYLPCQAWARPYPCTLCRVEFSQTDRDPFRGY